MNDFDGRCIALEQIQRVAEVKYLDFCLRKIKINQVMKKDQVPTVNQIVNEAAKYLLPANRFPDNRKS